MVSQWFAQADKKNKKTVYTTPWNNWRVLYVASLSGSLEEIEYWCNTATVEYATLAGFEVLGEKVYKQHAF